MISFNSRIHPIPTVKWATLDKKADVKYFRKIMRMSSQSLKSHWCQSSLFKVISTSSMLFQNRLRIAKRHAFVTHTTNVPQEKQWQLLNLLLNYP